MPLEISDPNHWYLEVSPLQFDILGGIKLDGLDRLRATLKVRPSAKASHLPLRHSLDLYNDNQLERFCRKVSQRFSLSVDAITTSFGELTESLENYRLEQLDSDTPKEETTELSEEEKQEALTFLKQKNLLKQTNELIGQSGVIGEDQNRLLMFLIFTTRKRRLPLHCISLGASGSGKTHLQDSVAKLIPEDERISMTGISDKALYYYQEGDLAHKLLLLEDLDGAQHVEYTLRELQSKQEISRPIVQKDKNGRTHTKHLHVKGPVCMGGCTTREQLYEDNANRSFLIYLDTSKQQDDRIMEYQRLMSAGKINIEEQVETRQLLQHVQTMLKPISVRNPYAEHLTLPSQVLKPRRTNAHYLHFIEAVTFYHQYQRKEQVDETTGETYIQTTLADIEQANGLMKDVLLRKSDILSQPCRQYLERLKAHLAKEKEDRFTNRSASLGLRVALSSVKRYHDQLLNHHYIKTLSRDKLQGFSYQITSPEEYETLQTHIHSAFVHALSRAQAAHQPRAAQTAK